MKKEVCRISRKGFTLIEMLLAVTLFAVVISSTVGLMSMGLQIWRRAKNASQGERKVILALEKMGQDVRGAGQTKIDKKKFSIVKKQEIEYKGTSSRLMIPALLLKDPADPKSLGGEGRITYQLTSQRELCRKIENLSALYLRSDVPCQVLAENVNQLRFRYWIATGISGSHNWYTDWDGSEGLPKAVEVSLEWKPKSGPNKRKFTRTFVLPMGGE